MKSERALLSNYGATNALPDPSGLKFSAAIGNGTLWLIVARMR